MDPSPPPSSSGSFGPEEELLLAVGRGEVAALEALYARFARPLMTFLFALTRDASLAEDLVQETFVSAWQAAPRWQPRARASTWLFTIARRAAGHALARRRPSPTARLSEARTEVHQAPSDIGPRLARAIGSLSEPLRMAFVLVRVNGLALLEAARVLEVPEGTLKSRLAAAEARLRLLLADALGEEPLA